MDKQIHQTYQKCVSEGLGTFFLVFAGAGAIVINALTGGSITHVGIGLTFGLTVMVLVYTLGPISGAHLNPAVTLAFSLARRFPRHLILPYLVSQLCGAILASTVLLTLFGNVAHLGSTLPAGSAWQSLGLEFLLTFFLMFVIMSVATGSKETEQMAGLAIGATVGLEALFAGPICGASMNPARSLGPALISGMFIHHWVYWIGPISGAVCGAFSFQFLCSQLPEKKASSFPPLKAALQLPEPEARTNC